MNIKEAYKTMQEASGIQVGDKVKVLRMASGGDMGWDAFWHERMDEAVGKTGTVNAISGSDGIRVVVPSIKFCEGKGFWFPFFALEVVEKAKQITKERVFRTGDRFNNSGDEYILVVVGDGKGMEVQFNNVTNGYRWNVPVLVHSYQAIRESELPDVANGRLTPIEPRYRYYGDGEDVTDEISEETKRKLG